MKPIVNLFDYGYEHGDWNAGSRRSLAELLKIIRANSDQPDEKIFISIDINSDNLHNDVSAELTVWEDERKF